MRAKLKDIVLHFGSRCPVVSFEVDGTAETLEKYRDKDLDLGIKLHREHRSIDANKMLWACLGDIANEINADSWGLYLQMLKRYGQYTTILVNADAVEMMRRQWREVDEVGEATIVNEDGIAQRKVYLNCYFGSSTYDSKEFSKLLEGVVSEMKEIGLEPPPSRDMQRAIEQWEATHDKAK